MSQNPSITSTTTTTATISIHVSTLTISHPKNTPTIRAIYPNTTRAIIITITITIIITSLNRRSKAGSLPFQLPEPLQINLERFDVFFESKGGHRPKKIVAIDCLPFLSLTLIGGFSGDETYELRYTFLNSFFCVF
ncbi:hypothetical protein BVRB_4g090280 [Beta vulgaris subsp. vulgaris]|nr:hypothetical protein BVRB_4g090280 [Beta vulgaris subsp. vulgaris]